MKTENRKRGHLERLLVVCLAGMMAVIMAVVVLPQTAQAAGETPEASTGNSIGDAGKGSITITNPQKDVTYYAYRIFDVSYATTGSGDAASKSYSYSIEKTSPWFGTVETYANTSGSGLTLTESAGGGTYVVSATEGTFSAANFANALRAALDGKTGVELGTITTEPTEDTKLVKTELPLGYYLVAGQTGDGKPANTQALCSLTTTDNNAEVTDKNDSPFQKEIAAIDETTVTGTDPVTGKDVQVGAVVTYKLTGEVPDLSGTDTYIYFAQDIMTKGLTFEQTDFTVTIGGQTVSPETVTSAIAPITNDTEIKDKVYFKAPVTTGDAASQNGGGFELLLDLKGGSYNTGDEVIVSYKATVNKDSVNVISENKAELNYGTDPDQLVHSTPQVVKTISSQVVIDKYAKNGDAATHDHTNDKHLAGAKFALKNADGKYYKGTFTGDAGNTDPENLTKVEWIDAAVVSGDVISEVPADATIVVTDENGAAIFAGLANGTYQLVETEAPAGYNLLEDPVEVKINAVINPDATGEADALLTGTDAGGNAYTTQSVTALVANSDGSFLPSTGGMGTTIFYILGTVLIVTAGIYFVVKRCGETSGSKTSK